MRDRFEFYGRYVGRLLPSESYSIKFEREYISYTVVVESNHETEEADRRKCMGNDPFIDSWIPFGCLLLLIYVGR